MAKSSVRIQLPCRCRQHPATWVRPDPYPQLLLSCRELDKLESLIARQDCVVPLALYWKQCWVKVEIGLVKGKKEHDKREDTKAREWDWEKARIMKNKHRG